MNEKIIKSSVETRKWLKIIDKSVFEQNPEIDS